MCSRFWCASCLTYSRSSRASCPVCSCFSRTSSFTCLCALRVLCPTCSCVSHILGPTCFCASSALCFTSSCLSLPPRALPALGPGVPWTYVFLYFTCLAHYVLSCLMCLTFYRVSPASNPRCSLPLVPQLLQVSYAQHTLMPLMLRSSRVLYETLMFLIF